jgi:AraC family transcriptional regulator of adaptative response/methylated-DNA-[protein]-cysteine methyltransferase
MERFRVPSEKEMRDAIAARDDRFDGVFFYGVVTTGVYCLPSCRARPARPENLRFFASEESAIGAGFRACKRCTPDLWPSVVAAIRKATTRLLDEPEGTLNLEALAVEAGITVSRLRSAFVRLIGLTPSQFRRSARLRAFRTALREGASVTDAAFATGFGSLSRAYERSAHHLGMTPAAYRSGGEGTVISAACVETSFGWLMMAATDEGVCSVQFGDDPSELEGGLRAEFPAAELRFGASVTDPQLEVWVDALRCYLDGQAPRPDLPLELSGTVLQLKVWRFLLSVPEGEVLSYGELARRIGAPRAVRAVASACGSNRIGVLVPCHRVLRGNGDLGGYRWGLARKRTLLSTERSRVRNDPS